MARVTKRGQVTIPAEVRNMLGIKPNDQVVLEVEGDQVRLVRPEFTLGSVYGSVTPLNRPEDFKELSRSAWESKILAGFGAVQPRQKPENFRQLREEFERGVAEDVMAEMDSDGTESNSPNPDTPL